MASQVVCWTREGEGLGPRPIPGRGEVAAPPRLGSWKLLMGGTGFVLLTVGIFWFQFHRIPVGSAPPRWAELRWGYLGLLLCLPVETLASRREVLRRLDPARGSMSPDARREGAAWRG